MWRREDTAAVPPHTPHTSFSTVAPPPPREPLPERLEVPPQLSDVLHRRYYITAQEGEGRKRLHKAIAREERSVVLLLSLQAVVLDQGEEAVVIQGDECTARDTLKELRDADRALVQKRDVYLERDRRAEAAEIVRMGRAKALDRHTLQRLQHARQLCREQREDIGEAQAAYEVAAQAEFIRMTPEEKLRLAARRLYQEGPKLPPWLPDVVWLPEVGDSRADYDPSMYDHTERPTLEVGGRVRVLAKTGSATLHAGEAGTICSIDKNGDPVVEMDRGGRALFYAQDVCCEEVARLWRLRSARDVSDPPAVQADKTPFLRNSRVPRWGRDEDVSVTPVAEEQPQGFAEMFPSGSDIPVDDLMARIPRGEDGLLRLDDLLHFLRRYREHICHGTGVFEDR